MPGKWQAGILETDEIYPDGFFLNRMWLIDGKQTKAPASARHRAAKALERAGKIRLAQEWGLNRDGRRDLQTVVYRQKVDAGEISQLQQKP